MAKMQYKISMRGNGLNTGRQRGFSFSWSWLLVVLLTAALAVTLVITLPKMGYRDRVHDLFITQMQQECDSALSASNKLSRTASSNSSTELAAIRSSIYSMDMMNQTYSSLEGGGHLLVPETLFRGLYDTVDAFYEKLRSGTNTSDELTALFSQLEALKAAVSML